MKKLAIWIADHPVWSVGLILLLTAVCMVRITDLQIDSSTKGMMDEKDPKKPVYEEYKEIFGSDILTVVMITPPSGDVFNEASLTVLQNITDGAWDLEGVTSVSSLTTVTKIRKEVDFSGEEVINTDPLVFDIPMDDDTETIEDIRVNALETPFFPGNLVSADGRHAAVNIYTESGDDPNYDKHFLTALQELIDQNKGDHEVYSVGAPRSNVLFNTSIEKDQMTLVPAAVLVILGILLLVFRGPVAVSLPMVTGGLSIGMTTGFMAWMGYPVTAVSVMIPSILIVVGCTEDVHLIAEYYEHMREGKSPREALHETMSHGAVAITLTSLTTMLGFGSLALNNITTLKQFGIIAFFGLFANFLVTLMVVPAVMRLSKKPPKTGGGLMEPLIHRFLDFAEYMNTHHAARIGFVTLGFVAVALIGCMRLEVNNDPISFFQESSSIRQDFSKLHEDMAGAHGFSIMLETADYDHAKEPEVLHMLDDLQQFLEQQGRYDKTISLADFIKTMNREMPGEGAFSVPDNRNTIAEYLLLLQNDELFRYIDNDNQRLTVVVRHNMSGSQAVNEAVAEIDAWIRANATRYTYEGEIYDLKYEITGESLLLHRATDAMIKGQVQSLGLALLIILVIISLLFMSVKAGLIAICSNLIPILLNFGLMGWVGIPFNTGTCLVATIALGIAVDDTIHFMVRYQQELRKHNDQKVAMVATIRAEGRPISITSTALALGFAVMALSQFTPSIHMGILSALVMVYALTVDIFVNPVMLMMVQLINIWDFLALKIRQESFQNSLILRNLKPGEIKKVILLGSLETYDRDQQILREGEVGDAMYVVLSGYVKIFLQESPDNTIAVLEEGDLFGEMALLGEGLRSASAEALYDVELLRIDDAALERVARREPRIATKLYANISRVLAERVQEQTRMAVEESEKRRLGG